MPKSVERAIKKVEEKGHDKGSAIAILKASGAVKQEGKHLGAGPSMHKGKGGYCPTKGKGK